MKTRIHLIAAVLTGLTIFTFFTSTLFVELLGSHDAIADVKRLIVYGLAVLVPAIATTGITGFLLSRGKAGRLVQAKKRRMPIIAGNGLLVLVPCALFLDRLASAGTFDSVFFAVQGLELFAGAANLTLISLNFRDGLRLTGRLRAR